MIRTLSQSLVPPAISRTMPGVLGLLFAVSQASAMVDLPQLAAEIQGSPLAWRSLLAAALVLFGALSAAPVIRPLLFGPRTDFLWRMPLTDGALCRSVLPMLVVAALPAGAIALLLGPPAAVAILWLSALAGAAAAARSPLLVVFVAAGSLATGWWGPLVAMGTLALLGPTGRALRQGRPLGHTRTRTAWWRRGPVSALVQRDLLGLWRTWPATTLAAAILPGLLVWFVQSTLHRSWQPSAIGTGSVLLVGLFGWLPSATLGAVARVEGRAQLASVLPVAPVERAAAVATSGLLPMVPVVAGAWVGGTANGIAGALRVAVLAFAFASLAAANLLGRPSQRSREDLVSHGIFVTVFVTLSAAATPWSTLPLAALGAGATALTIRRCR